MKMIVKRYIHSQHEWQLKFLATGGDKGECAIGSVRPMAYIDIVGRRLQGYNIPIV
jgi:hypothetical protein